MAVNTQEQIDRLKTQAEQYGWVDSQAFKDKVNTQYWAGSYDKLVKNVATWIQSGAIQGNMANANKVVPQTPTTPVTPVTTEPVGTKIEPTTPKLPEATPIPTQPVEKVEIKTTETATQPITPKPTNLWVIQGKNVTSEAPQFKWADWQTYKTVRFDDGSLWTVRVWENGVNELVGNTYKDEQRADMKQIVEQGLNNAENVYRQIAIGGVIPDVVKNSSVYSSAKKRFDDFSMYSTMTDNQLSSAIGNGNILPGTTLYEDLMKDPAQKARIEKIQKYNLIVWKTPKTEEVFTNKSNEIAGNTKVEIGWQTMTLKQALEDGFIDQNELNAMTNNSEIITKAKEVETLKNEYDEKLRQYKNLEKTIKEELKWTWATTTDLAIAVANAQEKLLPWLQELESRTNNAIWTLTQMKADSAQLFATNLGLYNQQQARQFQLEDRAYAEQQATRQLEQQYAYQFGDLNSDNPTLQNIAIERAVKSMYENYPIPGMESQSVKVQKVKNLMAQGMSGTQAIAQVESEIRNSQRYKDYLASERAKITPQATQDWSKLSDWTLYNQRTWEVKSVWDMTTGWFSNVTSTWYQIKYAPKNSYVWYSDVINQDLERVWSDWVLSWEMIEQAGNEYWVNPALIAWIIRNDSANGKKVYSQYNYGNVWNNDTLVASWQKWVAFNTPQEWVNAVAENIRKRIDTYKDIYGANSNPTINELLTWVGKDGKKFFWVYMTDKTAYKRVENIANDLDKWTKIPRQQWGTNNYQDEVKWLTIWLGWTEKERAEIQDAIVKRAISKWITLQESKKELWYKTWDDIEFAKTRKEDYQSVKKSISESSSNAKTALLLLNQPQTAIWDVASVVWFLKTIDPASVARESEVAAVENARGVLDSLSNTFAKLKEWTKLTDTQRKQLKDSIQTIVNAWDIKYNEYVKNLVDEFESRWLDASVYIPKTEVEKVLKWEDVKKVIQTWNTETNAYNASNWKVYKIKLNP